MVYVDASTIFNPSFITLSFTFNDELIALALLNVVFPKTFNGELIVEALFNVVDPEIFKVDTNVEGLLKLNEFKLLNVVDVAFILFVDKIELVDNEFKLLNDVDDSI